MSTRLKRSIDRNAMATYVVYGPNTRDFPGEFVCRIHWCLNGLLLPDRRLFARAESLEAVRAQLPAGLFRFERDARDDPAILETWL